MTQRKMSGTRKRQYSHVNMLAVVLLTILTTSCTTHEVRYVERAPQAITKTQAASYEACEAMHGIYQKCYSVGLGETTASCAGLTREIYKRLDYGDREFEASLSLFCGVACTSAANRRDMVSYSRFRNTYCS